MTTRVVDASVVLAYLGDETGADAAEELLDEHRRGDVAAFVAPIFPLEVMNVLLRSWRLTAEEAELRMRWLGALGFGSGEPEQDRIFAWTMAGLTAYDASYVALAEQLGCELVTADREIVELAPGIARSLVA